ncbi:MAG: GvpL/GvpF family gas vesicle protein [Pseudanabaena sp.]
MPYEAKLTGLIDNLIGKREVSVKLFWNQTEELNLAVAENKDLQQRREALYQNIKGRSHFVFLKPLQSLGFNSQKCCHTFVNWY